MPLFLMVETETERAKKKGGGPWIGSTNKTPDLLAPGSVLFLLHIITLWDPRAVHSNAFWPSFRYASMWS